MNSEMHSDLSSSTFTEAPAAGYDRGGSQEYVEVDDLEAVDWRRARC